MPNIPSGPPLVRRSPTPAPDVLRFSALIYASCAVTIPTASTAVLPTPTTAVGFVVPIPTSPIDVMRSFSEPSSLKTKSELPSGSDPVVLLRRTTPYPVALNTSVPILEDILIPHLLGFGLEPFLNRTVPRVFGLL